MLEGTHFNPIPEEASGRTDFVFELLNQSFFDWKGVYDKDHDPLERLVARRRIAMQTGQKLLPTKEMQPFPKERERKKRQETGGLPLREAVLGGSKSRKRSK